MQNHASAWVNSAEVGTSMPPMAMITEREKVAHLLRRFGLGASESELEFYAKDGLASAIDKLIGYESVDEGFDIPITDFKFGDQKLIVMQAVAAHWTLRMLCTRRPLQEKLTLFWHDHFATSGSKVNIPPPIFGWAALTRIVRRRPASAARLLQRT